MIPAADGSTFQTATTQSLLQFAPDPPSSLRSGGGTTYWPDGTIYARYSVTTVKIPAGEPLSLWITLKHLVIRVHSFN